jgi:choline transport protein
MVPIVTIYIQAMQTRIGATLLAIWFILIFLGVFVSCTLTCSRLVWAFSGDNGLAYSHIFAKVDPRFGAPINSTILTGVFLVSYGAIYCGSLNAFNSFIPLSILGLNITYVVPQIITVWRGWDQVLPERHLKLGPWIGPFCYIASTAWVAFVAVVLCLPTFVPVNRDNMNYLVPIVTGFTVMVLVLWFAGKWKTFVGPQVIVQGFGQPQSGMLDLFAKETC